jgi:hypothetical protein
MHSPLTHVCYSTAIEIRGLYVILVQVEKTSWQLQRDAWTCILLQKTKSIYWEKKQGLMAIENRGHLVSFCTCHYSFPFCHFSASQNPFIHSAGWNLIFLSGDIFYTGRNFACMLNMFTLKTILQLQELKSMRYWFMFFPISFHVSRTE